MFWKSIFMHKKTATSVKHGETNRTAFFALNLFEEILNKGSDIRVRVTGRSMAPFLTSGDIVTIRKVESRTLIKGDIVFFKTNEGVSKLHRLVKIIHMDDDICFWAKGDALKMYDEPFYPNQVMGKVIKVEKKKLIAMTFNMESYISTIINYGIALVQVLKSRLKTFAKLSLDH